MFGIHYNKLNARIKSKAHHLRQHRREIRSPSRPADRQRRFRRGLPRCRHEQSPRSTSRQGRAVGECQALNDLKIASHTPRTARTPEPRPSETHKVLLIEQLLHHHGVLQRRYSPRRDESKKNLHREVSPRRLLSAHQRLQSALR